MLPMVVTGLFLVGYYYYYKAVMQLQYTPTSYVIDSTALEFYSSQSTYTLKKILLAHACNVNRLCTLDFQASATAYLNQVEASGFLQGFGLLGNLLCLLDGADGIFIKNMLIKHFAKKNALEIQEAINMMLRVADDALFVDSIPKKQLLQFLETLVMILNKQKPTTEILTQLHDYLKSKKTFRSLREPLFAKKKLWNNGTRFLNTTVAFLLSAAVIFSPAASYAAFSRASVLSKTQAAPQSRVATRALRTADLPSNINVFVVENRQERNQVQLLELQVDPTSAEIIKLVSQPFAVDPNQHPAVLSERMEKKETLRNALNSSLVVVEINATAANTTELIGYPIDIVNQDQKETENSYFNNLTQAVRKGLENQQQELNLTEPAISGLVVNLSGTQRAHIFPKNVGEFTGLRYGGKDGSTTIPVPIKTHALIDADRHWGVPGDQGSDIIAILRDNKNQAVNAILHDTQTLGSFLSSAKGRQIYQAGLAARYNFLADCELDEMAEALKFMEKNKTLDFYFLWRAGKELEAKIRDVNQAISSYKNAGVTANASEQANQTAIRAQGEAISSLTNSFYEYKELTLFVERLAAKLESALTPKPELRNNPGDAPLESIFDFLNDSRNDDLEELHGFIQTILAKTTAHHSVLAQTFRTEAVKTVDSSGALKAWLTATMTTTPLERGKKEIEADPSIGDLAALRREAVANLGLSNFKKSKPMALEGRSTHANSAPAVELKPTRTQPLMSVDALRPGVGDALSKMEDSLGANVTKSLVKESLREQSSRTATPKKFTGGYTLPLESAARTQSRATVPAAVDTKPRLLEAPPNRGRANNLLESTHSPEALSASGSKTSEARSK